MKFRFFFPLIILILSSNVMFSQGSFSGDLMLNNNFFMRDSVRGASGIPHYDNSLKSTDAWLQLMYMSDGLEIGARLDMYYNSNLHNPTQVYSASGIGMLYVRKSLKKLTITGGNIYEQIGSGVVFRAFEDRGLGIDNALFGIHLKYDLNENWSIFGMSGKQKNRLDLYEPVITASKMEGYLNLDEDLQIVPGLGIMNRTLDESSMTSIVTQINSYDLEDRFYPKYNVFSGSFYNTTTYKNLTWYLEYALKSSEAIRDETTSLSNRNGSLLFTTLGFSKKGIGLIGQYKRTENFSLRISPDMVLLNGMLNFLPPLTRQNTYRLTSRYAAAALPLGEEAFQLDLVMKPAKGLNIDFNISYVNDLDGTKLFREIYTEAKIKMNKKLKIIPGFQYMEYNRGVYENKPPVIITVTPFFESIYKISRKRSLRMEVSYHYTEQDFGSWAWALLEYNVAPNWSFSVSDMYNIKPKKTDKLHYPTVFAGYTKGGNRYTLAYVKQVEGIVCTGGVCRYEPAFSGVRFSLTSSF